MNDYEKEGLGGPEEDLGDEIKRGPSLEGMLRKKRRPTQREISEGSQEPKQERPNIDEVIEQEVLGPERDLGDTVVKRSEQEAIRRTIGKEEPKKGNEDSLNDSKS